MTIAVHLAIGPLDMAGRLATAAGVGALIGVERQFGRHPAGLRTHAIVALSSAVITLIALLLFDQLRTDRAQPDPLRVVQGLAQAIGFITAGLIFVKGGTVKNLTTAAMLWLTTAIGIACGAGQYLLVAMSAGFGLALVILLRFVENAMGWRDREDG